MTDFGNGSSGQYGATPNPPTYAPQPPQGFGGAYPGSGYPQPIGAPRGTTNYGIVGTVIGVILILAASTPALWSHVLLHETSGDFGLYSDFAMWISIGQAVVALVVLFLGIAGWRSDAKPVYAGIAMGIGGAGALGVLATMLVNLVIMPAIYG